MKPEVTRAQNRLTPVPSNAVPQISSIPVAPASQTESGNAKAPAVKADVYATLQRAAPSTSSDSAAAPPLPSRPRRTGFGPRLDSSDSRGAGSPLSHAGATSPAMQLGIDKLVLSKAVVEDERETTQLQLDRAKDNLALLRSRCKDPNSPGGAKITPEERWRIIRAEREVSVAEKRNELCGQLYFARDEYRREEQSFKEYEKALNRNGPPPPTLQKDLDRRREDLRQQKVKLDTQEAMYDAVNQEIARMRANGILNPTPPDGTPPW